MQDMEKTTEIINQFDCISLKELISAKLMNRVDTKFVFHLSEVNNVLTGLKKEYQVLEVNHQRVTKYENLYFETEDYRFYLDHHNNRNHRFKVRFRKYGNTLTTYLEIKERRKNKMNKQRLEVDEYRKELNDTELSFIRNTLGDLPLLQPKFMNSYQRITLVNESLQERFTLDFEFTFKNDAEDKNIDNIVIAELKQERLNRKSPVFQLMKQKKIRSFRISKYCLGIFLLYAKKNIKYNNFKSIYQQLNTFKNAV